ncbi:hypothetical protein LY76DRAFT_72989 [Colletotrichum caudatum]|nr:hypothetical protein LY76DRAFT_72989 [Colletotrichum caudatum]
MTYLPSRHPRPWSPLFPSLAYLASCPRALCVDASTCPRPSIGNLEREKKKGITSPTRAKRYSTLPALHPSAARKRRVTTLRSSVVPCRYPQCMHGARGQGQQ